MEEYGNILSGIEWDLYLTRLEDKKMLLFEGATERGEERNVMWRELPSSMRLLQKSLYLFLSLARSSIGLFFQYENTITSQNYLKYLAIYPFAIT